MSTTKQSGEKISGGRRVNLRAGREGRARSQRADVVPGRSVNSALGRENQAQSQSVNLALGRENQTQSMQTGRETSLSKWGGVGWWIRNLKAGRKSRWSAESGLTLPKNYEVRFIKLTSLALATFLVALLSASVLAPVQTSSADSMGAAAANGSSALRAQVNSTNYSLNLTSSSVLLAIDATPDGNITAGKDTVTVSTNNPAGYRLYLATNSTTSTSNNLYLDNDTTKDSINAINGSFSNPVTLTNNTWGYALNKSDASTILSYLDITPTTDFSDSYSTSPSPSSTWAGVPVKGNEQLIKITNEANTDGSSLGIYYGVKATNSLPSGTYFGTIQYTAIAEAGGVTDIATISPEQVETGSDTTLTITTSLNTNASNVPTSDVTVTIGEGESAKTCPVQTVTNNDSGTINITCTAPEMAIGTYTVTIFIDNYLKTYTITDGLEYIEPTKQYFQDFTVADCQALITNETITLYDKRDGNDYTVAKLGDGNCWQTQNLRLGADPNNLTTAKAFTLTSSDSNVISSFSIATSDIQNSGTDSWSSPVNAKHIYLTGNKTYGNYYNWYTATASTGTADMSSGDATSSICPSSGTSSTPWKLPPSASNGSYYNLFLTKLGWITSANGTNTAHFGGSNSTIGKTPYSFPLSGNYSDGVKSQGSGGNFWSRTAGNVSRAYYFLFGSSGYFDLQQTYDKYLGNSVRCVLTTPEGEASAAQSAAITAINNDSSTGTLDLSNIITMQQFSTSVCTAMKKSTASSNASKNYTLKDSRDGKTYNIAKLDDGLCWMVSNLRLGSTSEIHLTAEDTDITSDYYDEGKTYWATPVVQTSGDSAWDNASKHIYQQSTSYGNLYNWYTATAGTGTASMSSGDAGASICPKGWKLPSGGIWTGSFKGLTSAASIGNNSSGSTKIRSAPYSFTYAGGYSSGLDGQGSYGVYWSRTVGSSSDAHYLSVGPDSALPQGGGNKVVGYSVCCLFSG